MLVGVEVEVGVVVGGSGVFVAVGVALGVTGVFVAVGDGVVVGSSVLVAVLTVTSVVAELLQAVTANSITTKNRFFIAKMFLILFFG